jgi:SAM-dependent methyltransferase
MAEAGEPDFFPVDRGTARQPEACGPCALRGPCPGLHAGWLERRGADALAPVRDRPRSNSFNYVFQRLERADPAAPGCPVLALGVRPWEPGRDLFVAHRGRLGRYHAFSRDFSDEEILEVKHGLGQVYLDASTKAAPDDFARDLVKLRRSDRCAPCPERAACTGLYEPQFEDVFGRGDEDVRAEIARLRGDVLDVGCGDGPYDDLLEPAVREGRLRYTGLDPEPARLEGLRRRRPWAQLLCGTAEDLLAGAGGPRAWDHILVLRSWNHLREPERVARALAGLLRPGGSLLVVDNTAFGLARTAAQADRGEGSPAQLEHWRNDRAADAARVLAQAGWRVVEARETVRDSCNQWTVRAALPG